MRETHIPSESVWERLVRAVKEGSKRPSKSLKGSKLRRTSNLTFLKSGLNLHTRKHRTRDKYVQKILLHIQNKSSYIFPWWKEKGTALVKICRILLLSPPYWNWSYHNATQSEWAHRLVVNGITLQSAAHQGKWKPKEFWQLIDQKTKKSFILSFLWKLTGSYASSKLISLFSTKDQKKPRLKELTWCLDHPPLM